MFLTHTYSDLATMREYAPGASPVSSPKRTVAIGTVPNPCNTPKRVNTGPVAACRGSIRIACTPFTRASVFCTSPSAIPLTMLHNAQQQASTTKSDHNKWQK